MKKRQLISSLTLIATLYVFAGCKKLAAPDEASKEIIGTWSYKSNDGGFSGTGGSTRFSSNSTIEFSDKGVYKEFDGTKKIEKYRFSIQMSSNSVYLPYEVVFENAEILSYNYIINSDTLYLNENVADGFSYVFVRK